MQEVCVSVFLSIPKLSEVVLEVSSSREAFRVPKLKRVPRGFKIDL